MQVQRVAQKASSWNVSLQTRLKLKSAKKKWTLNLFYNVQTENRPWRLSVCLCSRTSSTNNLDGISQVFFFHTCLLVTNVMTLQLTPPTSWLMSNHWTRNSRRRNFASFSASLFFIQSRESSGFGSREVARAIPESCGQAMSQRPCLHARLPACCRRSPSSWILQAKSFVDSFILKIKPDVAVTSWGNCRLRTNREAERENRKSSRRPRRICAPVTPTFDRSLDLNLWTKVESRCSIREAQHESARGTCLFLVNIKINFLSLSLVKLLTFNPLKFFYF